MHSDQTSPQITKCGPHAYAHINLDPSSSICFQTPHHLAKKQQQMMKHIALIAYHPMDLKGKFAAQAKLSWGQTKTG